MAPVSRGRQAGGQAWPGVGTYPGHRPGPGPRPGARPLRTWRSSPSVSDNWVVLGVRISRRITGDCTTALRRCLRSGANFMTAITRPRHYQTLSLPSPITTRSSACRNSINGSLLSRFSAPTPLTPRSPSRTRLLSSGLLHRSPLRWRWCLP